MRQSLLSRLSFLAIFVVILLAGQQAVAANEIVLNASGSNQTYVTVNTFNQLQVSSTLSRLNTLWLNTEKGEFVELIVPSYSKSNTQGAPQLPVLSKLIEVPAGATANVQVVSYDVNEYRLSDFGINQRLFPAQAPESKSGNKNRVFEYNAHIYNSNSYYSEGLARVEVSGYLRGVQLANLILSPIEYNPVTNTIKVYSNLVVNVTFEGADRMTTNQLKENTSSPYFRSVYRNVLNYNQGDAPLDTISKFPVKYVIVSDPMFEETLQPFVKWKTKRGFKVIEAYTDDPAVGNSFNSIKAYLQNLYNSATPEDPAPTFVLFVGDVEQIPAYNCGSHVSDLYYCEYTGDFLPEVYYGRFSATNTAQLLPQINKTLQYEQYLMPDPSYLNEVVMIAGDDASHELTWGNGQINYGTTYYFNAEHNLLSHTYLQPEPAGGNYSQNIQADISNGVSYANYTAHGSPDGWANPSFSISDVASMTNADKYCLMVGNCCQTNTYNQYTFGEALLRAENKGALGYIGASNNSYWDEDYWWGVGNGQILTNPTYESTGLGAYDRTFHDHGEPMSEWYSTMDQMVFAGNLAVQESNSSMKQYYWEIYCLMGDPSTMVYFSVPPAMQVDYTPLLPLGTPSFEINTEPYAYVAISKNNILHGVAEADENGLATVALLPFTEPGYADIVITKQNREPFIDSVLVASPEGPYLVLDGYALHDNGGNNNQTPEFGEPITVDLSYENFGNSDAVNAVSTLSTNDAFVSLPQNTHTWPLIASNGSASANGAFSIKVNDYIPDMHTASFTITTQADTNVFTSTFNMLVYAPKLENGAAIFDDATAGNANGIIDPGETIYVTVPTTNTGHCSSSEVLSQLIIFGDFITSSSQTANLGVLAPGQTGTATFSFTVDQAAVNGSSFSVYITANAGPYNSVTGITTNVGPMVEDFNTGNFLKYNWRMKGAKPWKISPDTKYEGLFGAVSGGINNSQQSEMYLEGRVLMNDTISFYRKVSCENGYDFLKFYVDGVEIGSWTGNKDWAKVSYPIQAGYHKFSWAYEKDEATIAGSDAAWIDYIELPPFSQTLTGAITTNSVAMPATICSGGEAQLYVFAAGGTGTYSYVWSPAASLNNATIYNPVATPEITTTYEILITSSFFSTTTNITVNVEPVPVTPVVTISGDHLVSSSATGNQWYNSQGMIAGATSQTYYPEHTETYYVIASSQAGCPSEASNQVVFGFTGTNGRNADEVSVYPNPFRSNLNISYSLKVSGDAKIEIYNSIGNCVSTINETNLNAGKHVTSFDESSLAAGVYFCKLTANGKTEFIKIVKNK